MPDTPTVYDFVKVTLSNIPEHTMARVYVDDSTLYGTFSQSGTDSDSDTLAIVAGGSTQNATWDHTFDPNTGEPAIEESANYGCWFAHSGNSIEVTVSGEDLEAGDLMFADISIAFYNPTISASGGGSMTEVGNSNDAAEGVGHGSGNATFTIGRDLPEGWSKANGDEDIPSTTVNVSKSGTAATTRYTHARGSADLPDGQVTLDNNLASKSYIVIPIDDSQTESSAGHSDDVETIKLDVITGKDANGDNIHVLLNADIADDSEPTAFYASPGQIPGPTTTQKGSFYGVNQVLETTDQDGNEIDVIYRHVLSYSYIDTWEAVGVQNTSNNWGLPAHISVGIGHSSTETHTITLSDSTLGVAVAVGRTVGTNISVSYNDTTSAGPHFKWRTELYLLDRKCVETDAIQIAGPNDTWTTASNPPTTSVVCEGDVVGESRFLHSVSIWTDPDSHA